MKLPILVFLISVNYCLSDIIDEDAKKFNVKPYPKKFNGGLTVINNAGKYIKLRPDRTKKVGDIKEYTAFPGDKLHVPDSLYFPLEKHAEKHRVKKVLNDYVALSRKKRSSDRKKDDKKKSLTNAPVLAKKNTPNVPTIPGTVKPTKPNKPAKSSKRLKSTRKYKPHKPRRNGKNNRLKKRHQRLRKGSKRLRRPRRSKRLRSGTKNLDKMRARFGAKQADRLINARKNFWNGTKAPQKDFRRLIAAKDGLIEEYPYVVSIQKEREHWCAGALLNPRMVITTANCIWKANRISRMHVRAGSRHSDRGGQVAKISEVMKHPMWSIRTDPDHDIGLLLLDRNLKFSNSLHSVDLPNRVMMPAFDDVWVTSWGAERKDGIYIPSSTLQVYHARVLDRKKCNNVTERFGMTVTENFICVEQTGRRAPCTRDTGAPAVSDGVLWGLASWGLRRLCGTERFPAMFSYVGAQENLDFIINATHELMADERFYPFPDRFRLSPLPSHATPT